MLFAATVEGFFDATEQGFDKFWMGIKGVAIAENFRRPCHLLLGGVGLVEVIVPGALALVRRKHGEQGPLAALAFRLFQPSLYQGSQLR